jgi:hypothetical protein
MQMEQTARITDATSSGGSVLSHIHPEIDLQRNDTLSLGTDEMAEIVALDIQSFRVYVDDNDFGSQGNVRASQALSINHGGADWVGDNDLEDDDIGNSDLHGRTRLEDDPRILWQGHATYQNGTGVADEGAPINYPTTLVPNFINFRQRFGGGPLVDDSDSLVFSSTANVVNMGGNANVVIISNVTAYADVFEVDRNIRVRS